MPNKFRSTEMVELGYALSSEEHGPLDLMRNAQQAERAGFSYALISDHFHPWLTDQPHSPLVWSVIGGIAATTKTIRLGTGVTCPLLRYHPAIVAQAAATSEAMMPGRFFLGLGTGENLNEHIVGQGWPAYQQRAEMFEEAVEIIRLLLQGGEQSFYGSYYTVENARIFTLPEKPPPIFIAASGKQSAEMAGELGDGLITTSADAEVVRAFNEVGGDGKPVYGQITVCWAKDEQLALRTAMKWWRSAAVPGQLSQDLPTPSHFDQAAQLVREEDLAKQIIFGPDPEKYREKIKEYADAGVEHVYLHQVGPDQEGFFRFAAKELLAGSGTQARKAA
jgi:coenzyme F420-dependent glucose-6-phosphate dehydrogenase